ncbi:TetR family transcriptional regulator [Nocardia brasiliensis ATCC 700358]|uniref:TetR family transcriptional regulator n=2 Tax=Nocardia brasiliensis TaxID=37326 RepID=K0FCU0_NOCB7|nr:TetR family transcriptional regulator [Nocardia brasiliensis ATCC 700358]
MEAVAKRAGVGKSALYRRWPSKLEMALAVLAEFSASRAAVADTGSLRGDLRKTLDGLLAWLTHPAVARAGRADLSYTSTREPMITVRSPGRPKYSAASAVM